MLVPLSHPDLCTAQCRCLVLTPVVLDESADELDDPESDAQPTPPPAQISVREAVGEQPGHLRRHRLGRRRYAIWRRWRRPMAINQRGFVGR